MIFKDGKFTSKFIIILLLIKRLDYKLYTRELSLSLSFKGDRQKEEPVPLTSYLIAVSSL